MPSNSSNNNKRPSEEMGRKGSQVREEMPKSSPNSEKSQQKKPEQSDSSRRTMR